jgi:hypothetical protein
MNVNHKTVARIMREQGLQVRPLRRFVRTTDSQHDNPIFLTFPIPPFITSACLAPPTLLDDGERMEAHSAFRNRVFVKPRRLDFYLNTLRLPKGERAQPRRIEIKGADVERENLVMMAWKDPYAILGVGRGAPLSEIKRA